MSVRSFDLSNISPGDLEPLRKAVREVRTKDGDASLWLTWRGELGCPLTIARHASKNLPEKNAGTFCTRDGIFIRNFGNKRENAYYHFGGFTGTLIHEWCHRIQWYSTRSVAHGWYRSVSHPKQDLLYKKWSGYLEGTYAAEAPHEMAAELFRVLKGWRDNEPWEENEELLADWREFFMSDPTFSLMMDC